MRIHTGSLALACVAAVAVPTAILATATPASAVTCSYTPSTVTLRQSAIGVDFDVPGSSDWNLYIPDVYVYVFQDDTGDYSKTSMDPTYFSNSDAGSHHTEVSTYDEDLNADTCFTTFKLKRASSLSLTVSAKSGVRTLSGKLTRVNFGYPNNYGVVSGAKLVVQHQTGSGAWVNDKGIKTSSTGTYATKVVSGPRTWRIRYDGLSTTQARTSSTRHA